MYCAFAYCCFLARAFFDMLKGRNFGKQLVKLV